MKQPPVSFQSSRFRGTFSRIFGDVQLGQAVAPELLQISRPPDEDCSHRTKGRNAGAEQFHGFL